jgi:hypothetical protein
MILDLLTSTFAQYLYNFHHTYVLHLEDYGVTGCQLQRRHHGSLDVGRSNDWNHRQLSPCYAQVLPTLWHRNLSDFLPGFQSRLQACAEDGVVGQQEQDTPQ